MSTFNPQPKTFKPKRAPRRLLPMSKRRQSKADLRREVVEFVLARDGYRCVAASTLGPCCANPARATELGLSLPSWTPHCTPTDCTCDFERAA